MLVLDHKIVHLFIANNFLVPPLTVNLIIGSNIFWNFGLKFGHLFMSKF